MSMEYEDTEMARDVRISSETREKYDDLVESEDSPFIEAERSDLFVFAAGYARRKAGRAPLDGAQHALFQVSQLSDRQQWIVKSIAVRQEETANVLRDEKQVYKIAREYAKQGIEELHSLYLGPGDMYSELMRDVGRHQADEEPPS